MNIKEIKIKADNLLLDAKFYVPGEAVPYPAVCICHGIPSGTKDQGDGGYPALAVRICKEGFAVLIFNFRGAGTSEGNFDIIGWTRDLAAAIDYLWLQPEVNRSNIYLLGFSAGAAVSICTGSQDKSVAAVAACASPANFDSLIADPQGSLKYFRSIGIIRDENFPEFEGEWEDNFKIVNPLFYVAGISPRPLLLVHGDKDDVVDVKNATQLYEAAKDPKKLIIIKGAGHRLRRDERAVKTVVDWLKGISGLQ